MPNATEPRDGIGRYTSVAGINYQNYLLILHQILKPKRYFEIGTLSGGTLKLASCASISVDPRFQISSDVLGSKPACHFFQCGSDLFFSENDPSQILGGPIDLAFLDGMHLFEFLLRDFANTESKCRSNSIIAMHDTLPPDVWMTSRNPNDPRRQQSQQPGWWTGDVWKIIPALKRYRPDLRITVLDCPPTGLTLVTNLNPNDRTIVESYAEIVETFSRTDLDEQLFDDFWNEVDVTSSNNLKDYFNISSIFWL
ncbi:MAG: class I SAM-dependent methyltransferase [Nitratireductor sp.]